MLGVDHRNQKTHAAASEKLAAASQYSLSEYISVSGCGSGVLFQFSVSHNIQTFPVISKLAI
jgi:hypothetical protein